MKSVITITVFLLISLLSCDHKEQSKAFAVFNEGVTLNLQAIEEQNRGNPEKATALNKQSIDKFKETLKLDSTHPLVRSSPGYKLKKFCGISPASHLTGKDVQQSASLRRALPRPS